MLIRTLATWRRVFFVASFPAASERWRWLPVWLGIAFVLRAAVALHSDVVVHHDEFSQYLEPAHWLVFGNGVLAVEFFYGARSWLVPGFVASVLWLCKAVGLGEPWFYIGAVKLAFCLLSLLIPWGVYNYGRSIANEQAARLALILACVWPYMIVYAHKPLTEFVATDVFMAALGLAALPACRRSRAAAIALGMLTVLVALIRLQYAPAAAVLWLAVMTSLPPQARWSMLGGSVAATTLIGLLEWFSWGGFFASYFNNLHMNGALDLLREAPPWHFYLPRLAYATGGGALLALWMLAKRPRPYLLLSLCLLAILLPHIFGPGTKQFRFIFLALVLMLIPLASCFSEHVRPVNGKLVRLLPVALASVFSLLVLGNLLPYENWLHDSEDNPADINYARKHNSLFAAYRLLAEQGDVTGVADYSSPYLHTPKYYYLHQRVPYYDVGAIAVLTQDHGLEVGELASHLITDDDLPPGDRSYFQLWQVIGNHKIYRNTDNNDVIRWQDYTVWNITSQQYLFFGTAFKFYDAIPQQL